MFQKWMLGIIKKFLEDYLDPTKLEELEKLVKTFVVEQLAVLAAKTDNDIDDMIVQKIKEAWGL